MTPMRGVSSAAVYAAANVVNGLLPFLLMAVLTRVLPVADYGRIAMFGMLISVCSALTGAGVQGAINARYDARATEAFRGWVVAGAIVVAASTLLLALPVTMASDAIARFTGLDAHWVWLAVPAAGAMTVAQVCVGVWMMQRRAWRFAAFQIGSAGAGIALSLALVLWVTHDASGRIWGQAIGAWITGAFALGCLWRGGWLACAWSCPRARGAVREAVREVAAFSVPLIPHFLGGFLLVGAERWIATQTLGLDAAGIYMVAAQIGVGFGLVADGVNKALTPWAYARLRGKAPGDHAVLVHAYWRLIALAAAGAVVLLALSPWLVALMAGPAYREAARVLPWIALGYGCHAVYLLLTHSLYLTRRTRLLGLATPIAGGAGLLVGTWLAPRVGIAGIGMGFAFGMACRCGFTWYLAQRACPLPWFGGAAIVAPDIPGIPEIPDSRP